MKSSARRPGLIVILVSSLLVIGTVIVMAQGDATCAASLEAFYTSASAQCIGRPAGFFCNGGTAPAAEPAGPVSASLASSGALVETGVVDAIHTGPFTVDGSGGGLAWMRVIDTGMSGVLLGDVRLQDVSPPDFPAWQSMVLRSGEAPPACHSAPRSAFVAQNLVRGQPTRLVINGISLAVRGTVMIQTQGDDTVFIALEGEAQVIALGQTEGMVAGQQIRVTHFPDDITRPAAAPAPPLPFEMALVRYFPVPLLDRPTLLPQPGFVATDGAVNMRSAPSIYAGLMFQVPPGQIMTILGRNSAGDWYHVRLVTGETGWMFAELLRREHGVIEAVYENTPVPPQRYGRLGTTARVIAPNGATMRIQPYVIYDAILNVPAGQEVTLLARSPYDAWVQVDAGGVVGWLALITLETQAIIESLPVDYSVPLPPEPTLVPGTWGNAFPDPNCYPNCSP